MGGRISWSRTFRCFGQIRARSIPRPVTEDADAGMWMGPLGPPVFVKSIIPFNAFRGASGEIGMAVCPTGLRGASGIALPSLVVVKVLIFSTNRMVEYRCCSGVLEILSVRVMALAAKRVPPIRHVPTPVVWQALVRTRLPHRRRLLNPDPLPRPQRTLNTGALTGRQRHHFGW